MTIHTSGLVERMGTEAAFRVFASARQREAAGHDVIHLELGEPGLPTPEPVVEAAVQALRAGHTGYTPAAGLPALRAAIARHIQRTRGLPIEPSQVVVAPGGKPVIFFTYLAFVEAGDEVIYPDPGFPIFESMVDALGAVRRPYDPGSGTHTRPDLDRLAGLFSAKTRLLVLNSPSNPTGVVLRRDELERIAALCIEHDVIVLSDEIYARILFDAEHISIASLPGMAERTVILDGFSKTWCMTGWRLGYAVAPPRYAPLYEKLMTNSNSCAVNFAQHGALAALAMDAAPLDEMLRTFHTRRDALVKGLRTVPGFACDAPEGAFFAFADIRGTGMAARPLADRLLEEADVAVVEGPAFGAAGEGFLRFSFAVDVARIQQAVERMRTLLA